MAEKNNVLLKATQDIVLELKKRNIPQIEIARITEKNKGTISKIFNGKYAFTLDDLSAISCELHIPVISHISKHVYSNLTPYLKKLLKALEQADETFASTMEELDAIKKEAGKAAS